MGEIGKAKAAIFLGNDDAEEFFLLEIVPGFLRQVVRFPGHAPVVDHAAQLFDRAIHECLFCGGQPGGRHGKKLIPIRIAGKQGRVPPAVAGFDRFALRSGKGGQGCLDEGEDRAGQDFTAGVGKHHLCPFCLPHERGRPRT